MSEDSNNSPAPADRALDAMQSAVGQLEDIHSGNTNAAVAGKKEQEAVSSLIATVAEALVDGLNQPTGLYAGAVSDECEYYSKTDIKQQIKDKCEELRGGDKPPLDEFLEGRLEEVVVVKTTDHRQGAEYIWDFGTFKVETRSGRERRGHFSFDQFRNYIYESGGVNTAPPVQDRRGGEEWKDFMMEMIDERGNEQYTRGPRTEAYESLANKLKRLTGYGTPEGALDHTGIWIIHEEVAIPDWWAVFGDALSADRDLPATLVKEVRVHESMIAPLLDEVEISRSAFYHELNARNLTVPGTSGASMTKWVDGSEERFWTLLPDMATPRTYVPDPNASNVRLSGPLFGEDTLSEDAGEVEEERVTADATTGGLAGVGEIQ